MKECNHEYEIIEKHKIFPKKNGLNDLYKQTTWTFSNDFLKLLLDKNITKEEILEKISIEEFAENEIGIYVLQRCKHCGELKEFRSFFNEKDREQNER